MKVHGEKFISWAQARKILEKKGKEKELGYEQKNALDHLRKFSKLSEKKVEEMSGDLRKMGKLSEKQIMAIVNLLPADMDDIRLLFAHEIANLSEDDKKKIISTVKKFS
jgi:DNA-directed RNA polymerase subunit F